MCRVLWNSKQFQNYFGITMKTWSMFHPKHAGSKNPGNIIIWDNNTAKFIILLENVQKLSQSHLWFDTGFDFDNYRDYVDISKLSKELDYVKALPGICAYTGMNYLPAFCSIMFRLPIIDDKNAKIYQKISLLMLKNLPVICMVTQRINALMMC